MPGLTAEGGREFEVQPEKGPVEAIVDSGVDIFQSRGGCAQGIYCRVQFNQGESPPEHEITPEPAWIPLEAEL